MLPTLRLQLAAKFLNWSKALGQFSVATNLQRQQHPILVFFHGYSLAHTIRPLVVARALRERGYHVDLAGRGPHVDRVRQEGFVVHDVETLPQSRMDEFVARGEYAYYDLDLIDRCVNSERALLREIQPDLIVQDMKPTVSLSARLEGVDEASIMQAYAQPGYPASMHLPKRFGTETGPFEEYLKQHADSVKPQHTFRLMADIPEFHPPGRKVPGYHYIGPLLDRPDGPQQVPLLDEGWDISLPLVYVTCGSSGRPPEYLEGLVESFRDLPYRLLVTTAGRWSGPVDAANIRVVDYIPGEWVLARAQVLVGVVGIGAIYQALSCGVPVIGAPEHLDQEYHLNRVQTMGLGVKMSRKDFAAPHILQAIQWVVDNRGLFERRCASLRHQLKKWHGGERAADLVDSHFRSRNCAYRVDGAYLMKEEEFAHYLDVSTPQTLAKGALEKVLHRSIRRGMPHRRRGQTLYFDRVDSWNWLYDNEPSFFQADYRALEEKRRRFFVNSDEHLSSCHIRQRYKVTYRYQLWPDELCDGDRVALYLPYPIASEWQKDMRLLSCMPQAMHEDLVRHMGFFYGHQFTVDKAQDPWEFAYTCQVTTVEQKLMPAFLTSAQKRRYLEVPPGLEALPEVEQFRRQLKLREMGEDLCKARLLYETLVGQKRFVKTKDADQGLKNSVVSLLNGSGGHCITLSRAYMALCRLEGIPTREVCGALIGYPTGENRYAIEAYGEPIFGHTWVEIFAEGQGWLPVEFHGVAIGQNAMTDNNVNEAGVRQLVAQNSEKYFDYYFGRVDNQRIICSNSVKRIPQCLVERRDLPEWDEGRWHVPEGLRYSCRLEVECL